MHHVAIFTTTSYHHGHHNHIINTDSFTNTDHPLQVEWWLRHFPAEQLLFINHAELKVQARQCFLLTCGLLSWPPASGLYIDANVNCFLEASPTCTPQVAPEDVLDKVIHHLGYDPALKTPPPDKASWGYRLPYPKSHSKLYAERFSELYRCGCVPSWGLHVFKLGTLSRHACACACAGLHV